MAETAGITFERNTQGLPLYAKIDLSKYGERLMPFFKEIGVAIEEDVIPNKATKRAMMDAQKNKTKGFDSVDELLYDLKH